MPGAEWYFARAVISSLSILASGSEEGQPEKVGRHIKGPIATLLLKEGKLWRWTYHKLVRVGLLLLPRVSYVKRIIIDILLRFGAICGTLHNIFMRYGLIHEEREKWCKNIAAGVIRIYITCGGFWNPYSSFVFAVLTFLGASKIRKCRKQTQQGIMDTMVGDDLDHALGTHMFEPESRSAEPDRVVEETLAYDEVRHLEEQEQKRRHALETLRNKQQRSLLIVLRLAAAQRAAAEAQAMVRTYWRSWQLLRSLYVEERNEAQAWNVRKWRLKQWWYQFDTRFEALTAWVNGRSQPEPRGFSTHLDSTHSGGDSLACLYSRLARALGPCKYKCMWPSLDAQIEDVHRKLQWKESAELAALRSEILCRYWRDCGVARQRMWGRGLWAVLMSSGAIRHSTPPLLQYWTPQPREELRLRSLVPVSVKKQYASVDVVHAIEIRALGHVTATTTLKWGDPMRVRLFGVTVGAGGVMALSPTLDLLRDWLDRSTRDKLAKVVSASVKLLEERRLLEVEPVLTTNERMLRRRVRARTLRFLTEQDLNALEMAVVEAREILPMESERWKRLLLSCQTLPSAVAQECVRRRCGRRTGVWKGMGGGASTPWPEALEIRMELHGRPPPRQALACHVRLRARLLLLQYSSQENKMIKSVATDIIGPDKGLRNQRDDVRKNSAIGSVKLDTGVSSGAIYITSKVHHVPESSTALGYASLPHLLHRHGTASSSPPGSRHRTLSPSLLSHWSRRARRKTRLLLALYIIGAYGIPAYVFCVWIWHLCMQWTNVIQVDERDAVLIERGKGSKAPTLDDVLHSLPEVATKVSKTMGWRDENEC
ncbi:hypothetical protein Naga_100045g9 [Nannochloropsis gaditana]|uniref:Uncharacterized protein n=1 Tax=Nannochloropsis gaditana TaxID=72520 RepID=W7U0R1_9STRA|nr:hypothetical protein Naga_100045g9 [Nannochloropsis gaditana]